MSHKIVLYRKANGTVPALDFLEGLKTKQRVKAEYRIDMLRSEGNKLRYPHSDLVREGIFELRWEVNTDIFRIMYFFSKDSIVLLNGFQKKDRKTSVEEIERAYRYREDYLNRQGGVVYDRRNPV